MFIGVVLMATPTATASPGAVSRVASIFYYPWYGVPSVEGAWVHWGQNGHQPPDDIAAGYYPSRGPYSSSSADVVQNQLDQIRDAGIDEVSASWWGKGSPEDQRIPLIVSAATRDSVAVAVHIEPYPGRSVSSVVADIAYLRGYGIHTFYIYRAFDFAPADWAPALDTLHRQGVTVFAQTGLPGLAAAGHFDGIYTYDIVTYTGAVLARYCSEAHALRLVCAPSVGPGYEALRGAGDAKVKLRNQGKTYDSMWQAAIAAGADRITITSYNEWGEGTQIEPAAPGFTAGGTAYGSYDGSYGMRGAASAFAYLVRTSYWTSVYHGPSKSRRRGR
ncbi:MAG: alpha-mannosidase [Actinobacteria bacterium]|nr:alpha-mannosidase [Actinomycetota bacterium]